MAFSFFGGIHPKENKFYAENQPVQVFPETDIVVIPMAQHIGAPCKPLVKKGDLVTVGQKIGDNEGLCVPVHASVSGTVVAVEPRPHTSGREVMSVVIDNDFKDTPIECWKSDLPLDQLDAVIVYPCYNVATIFLATMAGLWLFHERLKKRQWIAIGAIVVALALLNL